MTTLKTTIILLSPFITAWVALFVGGYEIEQAMVAKILLNELFHIDDLKDMPDRVIVVDIRLPRVLLAGLVGLALSGAGLTLQGIFRNPLVDPFVLGISSGAAFGCAITVGFLSFLPMQFMAFVFAIVAVGITYGIAKNYDEVSRLPLILSGIVVSAFFTAMVSIVKFLVDPHRLQSIVYWTMGTFSQADWNAVKVASAGITVGMLPIYLMRWRLNVMSLTEDEAHALGINIKRHRVLFIGFTTLAIALVTSICGIIGWVGLIVPHLVRLLTTPDHKTVLPISLAAGATFMIIVDTLSRSLTSFDIPVGIITAIVGCPFFIYLMKKGNKNIWVG